MTDTTLSVPFYGATLFVIDHNDEPFTPMKQIVEGMGLDWRSQATKLRSNKERWGVAIITTPTNGSDQKTLCLPLRKLPGWLMTIHPNRVKKAIREKVIQYQNECDNVLWHYWTHREAAPRPADAPALPAVSEPTESELIPLYVDTLSGAPGYTVSARDVHRFLGVGKHYSTWVKDKVDQLVLQAGIDFVRFMADSEQGGRRLVEVRLALEAAKEVAAAQVSAQGRTLYRWLTEVAGRAVPVVGGAVQDLEPVFENPDYLAEAKAFCQDYLEQCRAGVKGGKLPQWDEDASMRIAAGFAYSLAQHTRWMLTLDERGKRTLHAIPSNAFVIPGKDFAKIVRDPSGLALNLVPEVMNACMERLALGARR